MMSSALTLNQKLLGRSVWPWPPKGLVTLEMPEGAGTPPAPRTPAAPNGATGEVTSDSNRRRMSSVISSDPIQIRRVWSILMTRARAFSWSGVHTRDEPGWPEGASATDDRPEEEKRG